MKIICKMLVRATGAAALTGLIATTALADITGAGSTFVFPIVAKWAEAYKGVSGNGVNYQSIGSGGGIAQIKAKTVTFGATDKPLMAADLEVAPRGVYMHPYRGPHGCIYLFAVDGAGTLVGEQVVLESQDPYAATNALR